MTNKKKKSKSALIDAKSLRTYYSDRFSSEWARLLSAPAFFGGSQ